MLPELMGVPTYYAAWTLAALIFGVASSRRLASSGAGLGSGVVVSLSLPLLVLLGAKAAYELEQTMWPGPSAFHSTNTAVGAVFGFTISSNAQRGSYALRVERARAGDLRGTSLWPFPGRSTLWVGGCSGSCC